MRKILLIATTVIMLLGPEASLAATTAQEDTNSVINESELYSADTADCTGAAAITDPACCDTINPGGGSGTITLTGNSNIEKVMAFLMDKSTFKFTLAGAAGAIGNFSIEAPGVSASGAKDIKPNIQQTGVGHEWPKGGWGIAQWTAGRRHNANQLVDRITAAGLSRLYTPDITRTLDLSQADNDALLKVELQFMADELNGDYTSTRDAGRVATDASQAAYDWENSYEGCTPTYSEEECGVPDRRQRAVEIYNQFMSQADGSGDTNPTAPTAPTVDPKADAVSAPSASQCGGSTIPGTPVSVEQAKCDNGSGGTELGTDPNKVAGAFNKVVVAYACPNYHSPNYLHMTASYAAARIRAGKEHRYNAGTIPGADCNEFVTTVIHDSGIDANYNKGGMDTSGLYTYMLKPTSGWHKIGDGETIDAATLRPGDVALKQGHTFLFVGTIPGFNSNVASASHNERTGMAGGDHPGESVFIWFRKN